MHRSERGAGTSAEGVTTRDGDDTETVQGRVDRSRERDPGEPKAAGRSGRDDLRGAESTTRAGDLASGMLRSQETAADLCQRGTSRRRTPKSKGKILDIFMDNNKYSL